MTLVSRILDFFGVRRFKKGEHLTPPRPWPDPPTVEEAEESLLRCLTTLRNLPQMGQMAVAMRVFGRTGPRFIDLLSMKEDELRARYGESIRYWTPAIFRISVWRTLKTAAQRAAYMNQCLQSGDISVNDCRWLEGLGPLESQQGGEQ